MINFKITKKIEYINSILTNQHTFEKILLAYIEKFTNPLSNIFTSYYETLSSISKNNEFIEELILNIIKFMEFKFYDKNEKVISTNYTTTTQDIVFEIAPVVSKKDFKE